MLKELKNYCKDVQLAYGYRVMHISFLEEVHLQVLGNCIRNTPVLPFR